jgi:hypothetical protein
MPKRQLTPDEQNELKRRNWRTFGWLIGTVGLVFNIAAGGFTALSPNPAQASAAYSQMLDDYCPIFEKPKPSALNPIIAATGCLFAYPMYFGVKIGGLAPARTPSQLSLDFPSKKP